MNNKGLSKQELQAFLAKFCWDLNIDESRLPDLLEGKIIFLGSLSRENLLTRLLTGADWYTVLDIIPEQDLPYALSVRIPDGLFPKQLKDKYI